MNLEVGMPLWSDGFGSVSWVGERLAGVVFLHDGLPRVVGYAPLVSVTIWAQRWLDLRAQGLVVEIPTCGILEESKGDR
jgi:hypothetical protein